MNVLTAIAGPYRLYAEAAVAVVLVSAIGAQTWRLHSAQAAEAQAIAAEAQTLAAWQKQVAEGNRIAFVESEKNRNEETRRNAAHKEITDEAQRLVEQARADAAAAGSSTQRLRDRANTLAAACSGQRPGNPTVAASGPPTSGAGLVLADVLGRASERAGLLAQYADQARAAGEACVSAYDSLDPVTP